MTPATRTARNRTKKAAAAAPPAPPRPFVAHHLVPPHVLLSEAESQQVLAELGTLVERLPKILVTDPGLRTDPNFTKAREAQENLSNRLVRVARPSSTAGTAIAYRVVVHNLGE
jgi:DNA-directed RNA polymerase subunit H (RpoH/RPB5)